MNLGVKRLLALLMSVCVLMSTSLSTVALAATLEEEIALGFGNIAWEKRTIGGSERDVCVVEITAASKTNPTFEARDIEMYVGFDKTVLNYYRHEEGQIAPYEVLDEFGDPVKTTTMDASTNRANSNNNGCVFALIIDNSTDHSGNHVIQSGQVILKLLFMPQEGMDNKSSEISFKIPSDATDYASKKNFIALANEDVYTLDDTAVATIPAANPVTTATYKIDVADGKAEPAGPVAAGTEVTITANAKDGQTFKAWTGLDGVEFVTGDANTSPATFKMPEKDLTVTATYDTTATATYKIDVTDGKAEPAGPVEAGTQVTITADAKDGQTFKAWTGLDGVEFVTGDANTSPAAFKMPEKDLTVKAEFEEVTEEVTITFASGDGSGTMEAQKAPKGKPFTMPRSGFKAPDGKSFDGWKIPNNDALVAAGVQFTFDADTTVTAQYKDNTNNGGNGGGGCYVATAVYGSYDCPEVWTLRRFRDEVLAKTWYGRLFIRLYYAVSPTAVRLFGESEWFQNFWHGKLDSMVQNLQDAGFESTPYQDTDW